VSDRQSTIRALPGETSFGEQLRVLRERAGLTQEELAERAGLSRDAISALERGRRNRPHPPTMAAIVDALGLSEAERETLRSASRPATPTAPVTPRSVIRRIPAQATRLIGRTLELDAICALVCDPKIRLVTLNGPAGVGKTRLAIEIGERTVGHFPGGTAFIPFSAIWDASLIMPTIASVLGGRIPDAWKSGDPQFQATIDQPFLIILDNLEHLAGAPAVVAELIATHPDVTVLVTSRAPLRLQGERAFPLHPFAVDRTARGTAGAATNDQDAVELFMERARAVDPGFRETERSLQAVTAICRRLDGLPLAIELAAARVKVLPPEAMLERLENSLNLLAGGPRDQEARLQSIRAAIAWSYDLLDPMEKAAFRSLAVFSGGFTMEAAEQVLSEALGIDEFGALELVASLIDKSLVRRVEIETPNPRYLMLFTIRSFGHAELEASPDSDNVHEAHVRWITGVAERAAYSFRNDSGVLVPQRQRRCAMEALRDAGD
jgi:predicted ATPase/DNA-binding XRE family transcriptional regulator